MLEIPACGNAVAVTTDYSSGVHLPSHDRCLHWVPSYESTTNGVREIPVTKHNRPSPGPGSENSGRQCKTRT